MRRPSVTELPSNRNAPRFVGQQVALILDGVDALDHVRDYLPDAILLDLTLLLIDGWLLKEGASRSR